jgi:hypothetical protein
MMAWDSPADEVLVEIPLNGGDALAQLVAENFTIRFRGKSFLLVQGDENLFGDLSLPHLVLDRIEPGNVYYLTWNGQQLETCLPQLEDLGVVLLRTGSSALLRIHHQDEKRLIALGLPLVILPESIKLYPQTDRWLAPEVKSQAEMAADAEVIGKVISAVSTNALRDTIYDLQENKDLDPPYTPYRSRYCLRVEDTDDPSDDACDNAADYIFRRFESYGLEVEYDHFPHEVLTQGLYNMRNVVATLPGKGTNSDRVFIICAHYDSIALNSPNWNLDWKTMEAPGANDNGSGTAGVLEAARILSKYDFNCTIKFIAFSGEELRLHGSIHYARLADEREEDIAGVLNLDMIAYDPNVLDVDVVANAASEWLVDAMLLTQREYNITPLLINRIIDPEFVYSDHAPFWDHGWGAILAIDNHDFNAPEFYPFMHTTEDTIDKIDLGMASRMVQIATGTLARLADPMGGTPYPDLAVTAKDISLAPENPGYGDSVYIEANIHNLGEINAEDVRLQICLVEPFSETSSVIAEKMVDVSSGSSARISASLDLEEWGIYRIMVKANSDYEIFEANGSNNMVIRDIRVGSTSLALGRLTLYPNPIQSGTADSISIAYTLSKDAATRLDIYNVSGELVYRSDFASSELGGRFGPNDGIEWDGANLAGEKVASGVYFCYIVAVDEYDTASVSKKLLIIK